MSEFPFHEEPEDMTDSFPHATPGPRQLYMIAMPPYAWGVLAVVLGILIERARRA